MQIYIKYSKLNAISYKYNDDIYKKQLRGIHYANT